MGAAEAVRLAGQLARTLDQLVAEEVPASRLAEAVPENVAAHWQQTLKFLRIVTEQWPEVLNGLGQTDAVARRNLMFDGLARRSEEHTSELQSLMRISYAVSCLK